MRYLIRLVGLISFVVILVGCSGQAGLFGPPIKVTPAIAPIAVGAPQGAAAPAENQTE